MAKFWARHPNNDSTQNLKCPEYSIFKAVFDVHLLVYEDKNTPETKILVDREPSEVITLMLAFPLESLPIPIDF